MQVKDSNEGLLIYAMMAVVAVGLMLRVMGKKRVSAAAACLACAVGLSAWILRWITVEHLPMQNMFEVFLTLGVFLLPAGLAARQLTGIQDPSDGLGDFVLTLILLLPAGFVFSDAPQKLPPALQSPLFGPHVAVYMLSYVLMAKAALQAGLGLYYHEAGGRQSGGQLSCQEYELSAYLLVCLGFPLLSLGLFLGSVWGKLAWGDWWGWDPKELWSLACWLMYLFYFHWRYLYRQKMP
ncbi:MAG: cytochrome c biogenesis protein CcsA, partial [Sedimentisphaerales bacterium]|nr:cytochrome c biogenesis protein CcsA [Sedimentisphaerales bacterium]